MMLSEHLTGSLLSRMLNGLLAGLILTVILIWDGWQEWRHVLSRLELGFLRRCMRCNRRFSYFLAQHPELAGVLEFRRIRLRKWPVPRLLKPGFRNSSLELSNGSFPLASGHR